MDTLYYKQTGPGLLYLPFDLSLIDTMIQIPDSPWYRETFHLSTGEIIYPIKIYTYKESRISLENLNDYKYMLLRFVKNTLKGDVYDWLYIDRSQHNTTIYDTLWHWGLYHARN